MPGGYWGRGACTKTRNNETKRPKRAKRNHRNDRNERNETTETTETTETRETKRLKQIIVSVVSLVSFRWFRFVVSGFSTCRAGVVVVVSHIEHTSDMIASSLMYQLGTARGMSEKLFSVWVCL